MTNAPVETAEVVESTRFGFDARSNLRLFTISRNLNQDPECIYSSRVNLVFTVKPN